MRLNYASNIEDNNVINSLVSAVEYEKCDMMIALNNDAIAGKDRIINNKSGNYTADEIKAAENAKIKLENDNKELAIRQEELKPVYDTVLTSVSSATEPMKDNDGKEVLDDNGNVVLLRNDVNAFRNILRLSACGDNKKFFKLVVVTCPEVGVIYEAMEQIHRYDGDFSENGERIDYAKSKVAFKSVAGEISKALRSMFSIFVESEYTKKVSLRFNKTDLGHIHECYVKGFDVKTYKKDGETVVTGGTYKTVITKRQDKDGNITYEGGQFFELLAKMAFIHLFK